MKANRYILPALLFLLALNLYQCSRNRNSDQVIEQKHDQITALADSVRHYKNELGQAVAEKKAFSGSVSDLNSLEVIHTPNQKKLSSGAETSRKQDLKAAVQIQEEVKVGSIIAFRKDSDTYAYSDSLLSFQVTVSDSTLSLDSLSLDNDKTVVLKETRQGTVVSVTNSNPYFKTADVDAILVPSRKKWFNSKAFKVGVFLAGFAVGVHISRPK